MISRVWREFMADAAKIWRPAYHAVDCYCLCGLHKCLSYRRVGLVFDHDRCIRYFYDDVFCISIVNEACVTGVVFALFVGRLNFSHFAYLVSVIKWGCDNMLPFFIVCYFIGQ